MTTHVTPEAGPLEAPSGLSAVERTASGRARWTGLFVVTVAAVAVFWAFDALPFQDLPAHAGLIAMRHRFAGSPFEQRFFVLAPHIGPYSLFRFLGEMLVGVTGPIGAVRVLATLPLVATPAALLFARRRLFGDASPTYGFLGLLLSFSHMALLGFASYLLGIAVFLVALTLWLDLLVAADDCASDLGVRELVMAAVAPLVFVAHGHAFVLFLGCAGIATLAAGDRRARLVRLRALVPAIALAAWVAWIERGHTTPDGSVPVVPPLDPVFHSVLEKLGLLVTPTLLTRSSVIDVLICVVVWGLAFACVVFGVRALKVDGASRRARHTRALHACALVLAVVFAALPHAIGWFGYVDGRLVPIILYLMFLGAPKEALPRSFARTFRTAVPIMAATMTFLALVASYEFQDEAAGYREVLARVPAETRLLNLPLDPNSDIFTAHPFIHYDKLVLAERPVLVSDVWFHQGSALYPTAENPALRLPESYSESDLKRIDWPLYRLDDWDYVLIRTKPTASMPVVPSALSLDSHHGGWWLFRTAANEASHLATP